MNFSTIPVHKTPYEPLTWDFKLDMPYTQTEVYNELSNLDWDHATPNVMNHRYEMSNLTSPCLKGIHDYVVSTEFRDRILDILYDNNIYWFWSVDKEDMRRLTGTGGVYVVDKPGFTCPRHVDNRTLVATGMLMFDAEDDPDHRTFFYNTEHAKEKYWESSSKFGHGWLNANLHNTWHEGYNTSNTLRYSYLFHLSLRIF